MWRFGRWPRFALPNKLCEARPFFMPNNVSVTVDVNLSGLKKYSASVDAQLHHRESGPITKAFKQWGVRYRSFLQERFDKFSKGGGNWPKLKPATIARRRKGKFKGKRRKNAAGMLVTVQVAILRDMGILYAVLSPIFSGKPGQLEDHIPFGIRVGFGGPHRHPNAKATIADIASFHNAGLGHLPVRQIIVDPTIALQSQMTQDMDRGLKQMENE